MLIRPKKVLAHLSPCHPVSHGALCSHTVKEMLPRGRLPIPNSSPFQRLEIPLRTKRPDMIAQHCRRGRELGTVLIRTALLSGKILKGMLPIVVNCMALHSVPSAAGMCYLVWIGETSILSDDQYLCFVAYIAFYQFHRKTRRSFELYRYNLFSYLNFTCSICAFTQLYSQHIDTFWHFLTKFPFVLSKGLVILLYPFVSLRSILALLSNSDV